jgi:hypothetical protein
VRFITVVDERQCNDIWQAPTWSGIEYGGKWKLLQNAIKHVFEPVMVSMFRDKDLYEVHVCSDLSRVLTGTIDLLKVTGWQRHNSDMVVVTK